MHSLKFDADFTLPKILIIAENSFVYIHFFIFRRGLCYEKGEINLVV